MDKYIIDGVEYEHGEEVEVSNDNITWNKETFIHQWVGEYGQNIIIVEKDTSPYIRKIQPTQSLSGRKAKLTLDDGTEYSWVIEEIEIIRT